MKDHTHQHTSTSHSNKLWHRALLLLVAALCLAEVAEASPPQKAYFHKTKSLKALARTRQARLKRGKIVVKQLQRKGRRYFRAQGLISCGHQKIFDAFYDMKQARLLLAGKPKMEKRRKLNPETWLIRTRVKVMFSTITTHLRMTFFRSKRRIESVLSGQHTYAKALYTRWDFEPVGPNKTLVTYSTYSKLKNRTYGWFMRKKHPWTMRKTMRNLQRYCKRK